jgi:hypothetical protein
MILWEVWHHKYGIIYHALDRINYTDIVENDDRDKAKDVSCISE